MRQGHRLGAITATALGLLFLAAAHAQAQFPVNIVAGPNFTNLSTDEYDTSSRLGFFVAVGTAFEVGENLAITPYVGYVQKGAKFEPEGEDIYSYIEIPVLLSVGIPLSETLDLGLSAGPQVAFNIKCNETFPSIEDFDCKEYTNYDGSTEFGIVGSAALQFPVGSSSLSVGGGFDIGLTDIFTDLDGGYKNRGFYILVGYGTSLGGM